MHRKQLAKVYQTKMGSFNYKERLDRWDLYLMEFKSVGGDLLNMRGPEWSNEVEVDRILPSWRRGPELEVTFLKNGLRHKWGHS